MKKKNIAVDFDESNGSFNIWVAVLTKLVTPECDKLQQITWHAAFTSRGAAMAFFSTFGDPDKWVNNKGVWSLDLKSWNDLEAIKVELNQLLLVEA